MQKKLISIVSEILDINIDDIQRMVAQSDEIKWDSLSLLKIITAVEEEFSIKFTMDEIQQANNFEALNTMVNDKAANE